MGTVKQKKPDLRVGRVAGPRFKNRDRIISVMRKQLDATIRKTAQRAVEEREAMKKVIASPTLPPGVVVGTKNEQLAKRNPKSNEGKTMNAATTTKKTVVKIASKKPAAKKPETKAAKKSGPSLGREGSVSHLFRSLILKGLANDKIVSAARKAFPKAAIGDHYATWYRSQMVRSGKFTKAQVETKA